MLATFVAWLEDEGFEMSERLVYGLLLAEDMKPGSPLTADAPPLQARMLPMTKRGAKAAKQEERTIWVQ
jgi:hypothetical protein